MIHITSNIRSKTSTGFTLCYIVFKKDYRTRYNSLTKKMKDQYLSSKPSILDLQNQNEIII